jgi:hypothetical protein
MMDARLTNMQRQIIMLASMKLLGSDSPFAKAQQFKLNRTHMNKEQIEKLIAHTKSNVSDLQEELNRFACCIARCSKILGDERSLLSALESDLKALCEEDEE